MFVALSCPSACTGVLGHREQLMDTTPSTEPDRLLPMREVLDRVPVSPSTIARWVRAGRFPAPVKLAGLRRAAWREAEIVAWIRRGATT